MFPRIALASIALACLVSADGLYTKNSPVLQVTAKNYDSLIAKSNHTSIVEFYAPWCGHCKNLKPAYEKAAQNLAGLAKVAAVNCDDDANKPFCGQMGVQGFPTLKIVKPGSKPGRPLVEDYQGPRSAKGIVDAVVDKIPNHVKRIQDSGLDAWLSDNTTPAKAILFTDKGTTGALIKALAVDFLGNIGFAQIRNKEEAAVAKFNINSFPTIVLIPSEGQKAVVYDGELKKEALVQFFSQIAPPNPDPAPKKAKGSALKGAKSAASAASSKFAEASKAHKSSDAGSAIPGDGTSIVEDTPIESPMPNVEYAEQPMIVPPTTSALPQLSTASELEAACLTPKSGNCILVFLPSSTTDNTDIPEAAQQALSSFAEVADRYKKRGTSIFPFYGVPASNQAASVVREALSLASDTNLTVVAINRKRKWWRLYSATTYDVVSVESFVDAIKLGEGSKQQLPAHFFTSTAAAQPEAVPIPEVTAVVENESDTVADPEPSPDATGHDEL